MSKSKFWFVVFFAVFIFSFTLVFTVYKDVFMEFMCNCNGCIIDDGLNIWEEFVNLFCACPKC